VSLMPINGQVTGIRTTGLHFPLDGETLYPEKTRGISNWLSTSNASITIDSGLLLCIHETNSVQERQE
jgi:thiamine pyrophosphokinase